MFDKLIVYSREIQALPSMKIVYNRFLGDHGFKWTGFSAKNGKKKYTPDTFCKEFNRGTYILKLAKHVVAVVDGTYYDTWDCGQCCVYGYWTKETEDK